MHATAKTALKSLAAVSAIAICLGTTAAAQAYDWGWLNGPRPDTAFRKYLAHRYMIVAQDEDQDWDIVDSNYLRSQGIRVLHGYPIAPHPLEGVEFVQATPEQLASAHDFLVRVGANGAAQQRPRAYAGALTGFDCWVEQQQSEPNVEHNTQQCHAMFMRNAARLADLDTGATQQSTVHEKLRVLHSVYFDWNRAELTPSARQKLDSARTMLTDVNNGRLVISGYADASGSAAYNQKLSARRAQNVASYLKLPQDRFEIRVKAYGENDLHVATKDGVRKAANRVVDISVHAERYAETTSQSSATGSTTTYGNTMPHRAKPNYHTDYSGVDPYILGTDATNFDGTETQGDGDNYPNGTNGE